MAGRCSEDHNACKRQDFGTYGQYFCPICGQPEADSDVISGLAVDEEVGLDVHVNFSDSRSNRL